MKRIAMIGLLGAILAVGSLRSAAAHVNVAVGIGGPGFGAVITSGPAFAPYGYPAYAAPVHVPAPVVYPRPAYRWYGGPPGHYRHVKHFKHRKHCR